MGLVASCGQRTFQPLPGVAGRIVRGVSYLYRILEVHVPDPLLSLVLELQHLRVRLLLLSGLGVLALLQVLSHRHCGIYWRCKAVADVGISVLFILQEGTIASTPSCHPCVAVHVLVARPVLS